LWHFTSCVDDIRAIVAKLPEKFKDYAVARAKDNFTAIYADLP